MSEPWHPRPSRDLGPGGPPLKRLPEDLNGHRMYHDAGPTWCIDCGEFYPDAPCRRPGERLFDTPEKIIAVFFAGEGRA